MKHKILFFLWLCIAGEVTAHQPAKSRDNKDTSRRSMLNVSMLSMAYATLAAQDGRIMVYPNPATERIYVKGDAQIYHVELMNMIGDVVLKQEVVNGVVSVNDLPAGIYIVRVYNTEGQLYLSSKITKQ